MKGGFYIWLCIGFLFALMIMLFVWNLVFLLKVFENIMEAVRLIDERLDVVEELLRR